MVRRRRFFGVHGPHNIGCKQSKTISLVEVTCLKTTAFFPKMIYINEYSLYVSQVQVSWMMEAPAGRAVAPPVSRSSIATGLALFGNRGRISASCRILL